MNKKPEWKKKKNHTAIRILITLTGPKPQVHGWKITLNWQIIDQECECKIKTFLDSKNLKLLLACQIWYDIKQNKAEDQEREEYGLNEIALTRSWFKDSYNMITTLKVALWSVRFGLRGGTGRLKEQSSL